MPERTDKEWAEKRMRLRQIEEELKRKDLRTFNYQENRHLIDELLQLGYELREPRTTSGLVEMQRKFMKVWGKQHERSGSQAPPGNALRRLRLPYRMRCRLLISFGMQSLQDVHSQAEPGNEETEELTWRVS